MKKFISFLLILVLAFFLMTSLNSSLDFFNPPNNLDETRMSNAFIHKNASGGSDPVEFGKSTGLEDGSANIVTSVVVDYRSFDTLGEITVLFISALGVGLLLGAGTGAKQRSGFILKTAAKLISPLMMVTGIFIFTHGHLTPGGGFPGGSMMATAFLLNYFGSGSISTDLKSLKWMESLAGVFYIVIGLIGLFVAGSFLQNYLPTGTVGHLFSAGIIPIIYVLVGLKVGSEVSGIIADFSKSEVTS